MSEKRGVQATATDLVSDVLEPRVHQTKAKAFQVGVEKVERETTWADEAEVAIQAPSDDAERALKVPERSVSRLPRGVVTSGPDMVVCSLSPGRRPGEKAPEALEAQQE